MSSAILTNDRRTGAAVGFLRRLLGHAGGAPDAIVTGSRASYGAAKARLSERRAVEHRRVRAAARPNDRVEPSHEPTRLREYVMRRFTSVPAAQRFLVAFRGFCDQFRPRRHLLTAAEYRAVRRSRDCGWRELAGAAV